MEKLRNSKEYTGQQDHDNNRDSGRFTTLRAAQEQYSITKAYSEAELLDFSWKPKEQRFADVDNAVGKYAVKRATALAQAPQPEERTANNSRSSQLVQTMQSRAGNSLPGVTTPTTSATGKKSTKSAEPTR